MEVSSTDAHTGVAATIYLSGNATAYTLAATDRVNITDILLNLAGGGTYEIVFAASDTAGQRVIKGTLPVAGHIEHHFETPIAGPLATAPTLIAAAGQVDLVMTGAITEQ
jgi:hypothetical protein